MIKEEFKVFANAVNGNEMNLSFEIATSVDIEPYAITGKFVFKTSSKNTFSKIINVGGLPNGIYMIKINKGNNALTRKVVILK
ncbi:T9SS type A sorting domain-containing protein [Tamlana fucoidanivorans]|uniref:T9SS type A sorting domain-containing protein n=1 Tax=Allotamlana fucoidanivorans TaxID=2583814 RepID=A0A5C4SHM4_9FLAO|nr:T9SS type A sorting domain-containing protein [Tamlana fucoidanivorans]TNJ43169.1 T9SS type A sorting domain-containing protein [Tamlana fucoidanivorans]